MEKTCNVCGETKHISMFYKNKSTKDGLSGKCKKCATAYHMKNCAPEYKQPMSLRKINKQLSDNRKRHKEAERFMPIRKPVVFGGMNT